MCHTLAVAQAGAERSFQSSVPLSQRAKTAVVVACAGFAACNAAVLTAQCEESIPTMLANISAKLDALESSLGHPAGAEPKGSAKLASNTGYNKELIAARKAVYVALQSVPRIPELDYVPTQKYTEATKEEVLYPIINEYNCISVPGAYFGDEGKGKTVDAIARHPDVKIVARVNSGENAGHTVIGPTGHKYGFHLCPSGLLTPGKVNVVGPECVMDPVSFMEREISQLVDTNVQYKDRLFVGNVHLVCPHHKLLDLMGSWRAPNKSTLQGMAPVHASKAKRKGLRLDHLFNRCATREWGISPPPPPPPPPR